VPAALAYLAAAQMGLFAVLAISTRLSRQATETPAREIVFRFLSRVRSPFPG